METLFTFIAAKIVLAQLEGSGRGALGAYNSEGYRVLSGLLQELPVSNSTAWLEELMRRDRSIALRVMDVRDAYSREDFEWDQLQRLALRSVKEANIRLMRKYAELSLKAMEAAPPEAAAAAAPAPAPAPAPPPGGVALGGSNSSSSSSSSDGSGSSDSSRSNAQGASGGAGDGGSQGIEASGQGPSGFGSSPTAS